MAAGDMTYIPNVGQVSTDALALAQSGQLGRYDTRNTPALQNYLKSQQNQQTQRTAATTEQLSRNRQALNDITQVRQAFPQALQTVNASPASTAMNDLTAQVAANPTSIDDSTRGAIENSQADELVHGYNQSRNQLRSALAAAGASDSPAAMSKEIGMTNQLAGQIAGVRRDAGVMQAQTNLSDRLKSLGAVQGVQGQQANQQFTAATGQSNAVARTQLPTVASESQTITGARNAANAWNMPTWGNWYQ